MNNGALLAQTSTQHNSIQHNAVNSNRIDPLKNGGLDILSALTNSPSTTKQLAIRFGLPRARVQFVIDGLLENGFVYVYREIQEGDSLEIYYAAAAQDIVLALNEKSPQQARLLGAKIILESLQTNILKALSVPPEQATEMHVATLKLVQCRMSADIAHRFLAELEELVSRFDKAEERSAEEEFALSVALYPILETS